MNEAQLLTPARERKLRQLDAIAGQLRDQVRSLNQAISTREDERRHAAENLARLDKEVDWLQMNLRFAGSSEREGFNRDLTKARATLDQEQDREKFLRDEIAEFRQQQDATSAAWNSAKGLVVAVVAALGPAGEAVQLRLQGKG